MKHFFRWIKALWTRTMENLENPGLMLDQFRRNMEEDQDEDRRRKK